MALTRSWCLWELFATVDTKTRLEVALPPPQAAALHDALLTRFDDVLRAMSGIDTRKARAFFESDQVAIAEAVKASPGGCEAVNGRIHDQLRVWLEEEARAMAGRLAQERGALHTDALTARARMAQMLMELGKRQEALAVHQAVLRDRTAALGAAHADTLRSAGAVTFMNYLLNGAAAGVTTAEEALAAAAAAAHGGAAPARRRGCLSRLAQLSGALSGTAGPLG